MSTCKENIIVIGAGGHAKVVVATLLAAGYTIDALFDDDLSKVGHNIFHIPIIGGLERIADYGYSSAIIAIGDNRKRKEISIYLDRYCKWITVAHPKTIIHDSVDIGKGTVICAGVVIQPDTIIGDHVIINTGATVDHDCRIEDFVHVAPGAHLAGNVSVRRGAFLGLGVVVIPGVTIGEGAIVGAGSVVIDDIPPFAKVAGVPARPIRKG
jgi:sugar O-acyltransferase (sialic acid O-acetyltransferase NeuD family)